jgi:hypothetical protein
MTTKTRYRTLGDGLLAALTGLTRQAFHKARKDDFTGTRVKATFDRAVRAKLDRRLPRRGGTLSKPLIQAALAAYSIRLQPVIHGDLKKTHKVADVDAATAALADMLELDYAEGMTIANVLACYFKRMTTSIIACIAKAGDLSDWSFGKLEPSARQIRTLRRFAFRPKTDPNFLLIG